MKFGVSAGAAHRASPDARTGNGGNPVPGAALIGRAWEEQKSSKLDALRWWLTMKYDAILHSPDHNVFEIQGPSVQCLSENQYLTEKGERVGTGQADATNRTFA